MKRRKYFMLSIPSTGCWLMTLIFLANYSPQYVKAQDSISQSVVADDSVAAASVAMERAFADSQYIRQQANLKQQYEHQGPDTNSFNKESWKKATEGLDYTDHRNLPSEEKVNQTVTPVFNISQQTWRLIAFVILFAVLIVVLLKAFGVNIFLHKKKQTEKKIFTAEEFDETIPESELDRLLREALERNDYRLAIRIHYLMAIKELSQQSLIHWRKEKTNFDYVRELSSTPLYNGFMEITLLFERVWYGDRIINEQRFNDINLTFRNFLLTLKGTR